MNPKEEIKQLTEQLERANNEYYVLDAPTMADFEYDRLLRRLEETGLITRARDRADERRRLITLTSAGRDLRKRAATIPDRMIALYSQPAEDLERLKSMLDDMAARLA